MGASSLKSAPPKDSNCGVDKALWSCSVGKVELSSKANLNYT